MSHSASVASPLQAGPPVPFDAVKLAEAIAWPSAVIFCALVMTIFVILVALGKIEIDLNAFEKVRFSIRRLPKDQSATHPSALPLEPTGEAVPEPASGALDGPALDEGQQADSNDETWRRSLAYYQAQTLTELESAYSAWRLDLSEENLEYWEANHLWRRERLGATDVRSAMGRLATDHPTWATPYRYMIEWAVADHDLEAAAQLLDEGLKRHGSPHIDDVLREGVRLKCTLSGPSEAFKFALEWSKSSVPDTAKATAFTTLAELLERREAKDGARLALEMAIPYQSKQTSCRFSLAYSYSQARGRWAPALCYYLDILDTPDGGAVARNNSGILFKHMDKAVGVEEYVKATAGGDVFAPANIAHMLIHDGYIDIAERLLNSVSDPGSAAELHASAKQAALAARRAMTEQKEKITQTAREDLNAYESVLRRSYRHLQASGCLARGLFSSDDETRHVLVTNQGGACILRNDQTEYRGDLTDQTTCYAGTLMNSSSSLLGSLFMQIVVVEVAEDCLHLIQWPSSDTLDSRIRIDTLKKRGDKTELPTPQDAPPPSTPTLSTLFLGSHHSSAGD